MIYVQKELVSMNDFTAIAATLMAVSQSETQDQITMNLLKKNVQAEAAMADMLLQNARQIQAMSHSGSGGVIDLFAGGTFIVSRGYF
jgi:hypothetical protein